MASDSRSRRQRCGVTAREWLSQNPLILDTETTGLGPTDEIVQIAVVDADGTVLLNTLVRPTQPISAEATSIHGITDSDVELAPSGGEICLELARLLRQRLVCIYNADFDARILAQTFRAWGVPLPKFQTECVMTLYAEFEGEWSAYHGSYRWHKLTSAASRANLGHFGAHDALGDAETTRRLLAHMATFAESETQPSRREPALRPVDVSRKANVRTPPVGSEAALVATGRGLRGPAPHGRRLVAFVLDLVSIVVADWWLWLATGVDLAQYGSKVLLLLYLPVVWSLTGTSVGKYLVSLQVTKLDGHRPGFPRSCLRAFVMLALSFLWIAWWPSVSRDDRRGVHDLAAGTWVWLSPPGRHRTAVAISLSLAVVGLLFVSALPLGRESGLVHSLLGGTAGGTSVELTPVPPVDRGKAAASPRQPVSEAPPTTAPVPRTDQTRPSALHSRAYVVQAGDTLGGIAKSLGVPLDVILQANSIADPNRIYVGQELVIPSQSSPAGTAADDVQRAPEQPQTSAPAGTAPLAASPDLGGGGVIAFTCMEQSRLFPVRYSSSLCTVLPNGTNLVHLTPGVRVDSFSWSPDGKQLAYSSDGDIYIIGSRGGLSHNLTASPDIFENAVEWWPGGEIAFARSPVGPSNSRGRPERHTIDPATRRVTWFSSETLVDPAYQARSPNGEYVVRCDCGSGGEVCVARADGSGNSMVIAYSDSWSCIARWSPH